MASKTKRRNQEEIDDSIQVEYLDTIVFSRCDEITNLTEWFFMTQYGIVGPYESKTFAERCLAAFVEIQEVVNIKHCDSIISTNSSSSRN
jgi:hypothetical protein